MIIMVETLLVKNIIGYATIQDLGRRGYRSIGIPVSGVLDRISYIYSNYLLNNNLYEAVIEQYGYGEYVVLNDTIVCVTGGARHIIVDDNEYDAWKPVFVKKNSVLKIKPDRSPLIYIAIYSGVKCNNVLNSKSTYLRAGIGCVRNVLKPNDIIESNKRVDPSNLSLLLDKGSLINIYEKQIPSSSETIILRSTRSFHSDLIWDIDVLLRETYYLSSEYDRMGYRLEGKPLDSTRNLGRLPSIPVDRGFVQIPPDGKPIVLMSDSQTMGGYAVALHVLQPDVDRLAHAQPDQKILFREISFSEAERIIEKYYNILEKPVLNIDIYYH